MARLKRPLQRREAGLLILFEPRKMRSAMPYRSFMLLSCWLAALATVPTFALDLRRVTVGPTTFQVEIAQTPQERERGLMYRRELPRDQGMLFVQSPGPAVFWMKNTYIPLDLLYFDINGWLSQIEADVPPCATPTCPLYPSDTSEVRYILEINAGEAVRRGIRVGDRLRLE